MTSFPTLKQIFDNQDVAAAILFCVAAIVGQLLHGVKKSLDGESSCVDWFRKGLGRTLSAMIGNGVGMLLFIQTGVLGPILAQPNGWWAICLFGFMNGFSADSALNKTARAQWTEEQRNAQKPPAP